MLTDDDINADQDQDLQNDSDLQDHDGTDDTDDSFNARKASKTLSEKLNKALEKIETLEGRLAEKEPEGRQGTVEKNDNDDRIDSIVDKKLWLNNNKERINDLGEDGKKVYEQKVAKGYDPEDALRLAEDSVGISTPAKAKVSHSTSSGSVDRGGDDLEETSLDRKYRQDLKVNPETVKKYQRVLKELG